ncbi:class I SAM-dependent methyltransferase [Heliophilum fasciatum]|uniref:Lysine methyltransferase n=1 Tax=Heliophilum fasciatum TaxID=35700 RepID=A0A4R2RD97_9FIRM|nr:methyltransferase domain-containing protein [Heliophilum fasciatum]MCW2279352.1 putative nicotinamide N-methyase [Heliophilum fasciatum]TCP60783.1 lysine methyltransferase [Heliophilum fasciatum]
MKMSTTTVTLPAGEPLTIARVADVNALVDAAQEVDELPFWAELWPSSIGLAGYLVEHVRLRDVRLLELGAGLGLAGIAAARGGADVTQTDFIPQALRWAAYNAKLNGVQTTLLEADWRCFPDIGLFDVIIGSDILYEPTVHDDLLALFRRHLTAQGAIFLADPGRAHGDKFIEQMGKAGWKVDAKQITAQLDGRQTAVTVYRCRRRTPCVTRP